MLASKYAVVSHEASYYWCKILIFHGVFIEYVIELTDNYNFFLKSTIGLLTL